MDPNLPARGRALDIGAGHGARAKELSDDGWDVVAIDTEVGLLHECRSGSGVEASVADATTLPIRDGVADLVIAWEVMEHVCDARAFAREIRRVLAPHGTAYISVPTAYTERAYSMLNPRYWETTTHLHRFRREDLVSVLTDGGLHVRSIEPQGLRWALTWTVHALVRSDFDFTGSLRSNQRLEARMSRLLDRAERTPVTRQILSMASAHIGKSYVATCVRPE